MLVTQNLNKPNCCDKWEAKLNKDINWSTTFKKIQRLQKLKLKWFQIRLVHRILATNVALRNMGVENDVTCSFCSKERDAINHIFRDIPNIKLTWEQVLTAVKLMRYKNVS